MSTRPAGGSDGNPGDGLDGEVVIVGAGPVGLTLAILLAQRDHSVIVVERWPSPYPLPRAVHFDHEVGRILQSCGIGDELRAITEPAEVYEWRNAAGTTLLRFGRIGAGPSGWPESSMFCQPELEALLARRAGQLPAIEIRRGVEIDGLIQGEGHVVVSGVAPDSAIRARYAVGCDGANSTVRSLAGLAAHDLGFFYDWLIVDVVLDEPRVFDPLNLQICDPARPTTVVSGGPGRRRWEFMRLPHESLDELNDEARAWELLAEWDVTPGNARLERHAVYTFQARYAEPWRSGRVLIAGDAAHQMPPFAGQGMCSGIRDAANLAWKLDLVLAGDAPDALLDTYGDERLPSARQAIDFSMALGKVICVPDPAEAAERDAVMAAAVTGDLTEAPDPPGIDTGIVDADSPHAGRLFVQGTVDGRPFDEVHGAGWRLVTVDADTTALDTATTTWFASIGGRVVPLEDPDSTSARWFADHGVRWALQRPDFHLYGTATDAAGAGELLVHLRAQLTTATAAANGRNDRNRLVKIASVDQRAVLVLDDEIADIATVSEGRFGPDPMALYDDWGALVELAATVTSGTGPLDRTALGCPVPRPRQVFAIGLNYRSHAEESGMAVPAVPATFTKFPASLAGPFDDVEVAGESIDWEVELVAVVGRRADRVAEADAWDHIAGLTVGQDISDRHLQFAAGAQFSLGKSRRGYGPMGPWIVTPDEVPDPDDLALGCSVDGEVVQDARTSDLIFGVPQLVAELSAVLPLLPGDVVFTGTPAGVGVTRQPARFLRPGHVLESWIEGIGTIRNRCV